jgi:hypothetical protein
MANEYLQPSLSLKNEDKSAPKRTKAQTDKKTDEGDGDGAGFRHPEVAPVAKKGEE